MRTESLLSRFFATGGAGGKVSIMRISTGKFVMEKGIHDGEVKALQFSADGNLLVTCMYPGLKLCLPG